jgi:ATP-dependent DNA helicase RecG
MARLLQGDVGSGKTILAALALLAAVGSGYQAALMAPTELLAEQHYLLISQYFQPLDVPVVFLSGRSRQNEDEALIRADRPVVVVGTQALVSDRIQFGRLGLVVVDEQHRFGVRQRSRLGEKGLLPHMLVMTATPIPRTLALTVYGDLAVSQIDGLPPGRQPISTVHLAMKDRRTAYVKVQELVRRGQQAYVICPLVEDSEEGQGKAATLLAEGMRKVPGWRVGLVHGRMSAQEKSQVMDQFRRGEIDVLVGTTILEVGVDVPAATIIVIEGAERFGLAQLHQLRGRVGRGTEPSFCYLLADPVTDDSEARIAAMVETQNGLELAERDLELRGPGEVLGMRQHGVAGFQLANPLKDLELLEAARRTALDLLAGDRDLSHDDHQALRQWVVDALKEALPGHVLH